MSKFTVFNRLFARFPAQCTTRTAELAARRGSPLEILSSLSKHAPHVFAESVVTHAIEGCFRPEILEPLALHHPLCLNHAVHLAVASKLPTRFEFGQVHREGVIAVKAASA
ncbi:hypothetical protein HDU96_001217 [Phlyctochytrium bullatum]|nr:hypothetical protein HDU96_001217 [Phlyctochytrium bullatum]